VSVDQVPRRIVFVEQGKLSHDAQVWLDSVRRAVNLSTIAGTFANNAAAIAGGLAVGQTYQTAAGEVRVVV
jgi:hypothetical protein